MRIVDDLIEPELACECRQWLLSQTLVFGWKAHAEAPGVFWHRNFVLPGSRPHHYDSKAWHPEMTFERLLAEMMTVTLHAGTSRILIERLDPEWPAERAPRLDQGRRISTLAQTYHGDLTRIQQDHPVPFGEAVGQRRIDQGDHGAVTRLTRPGRPGGGPQP